jgi:hypothetical protein
VVAVVVVETYANLAQVGQARGPTSRLANPLHRGKQEAEQQTQNADDDKEFDQTESRAATRTRLDDHGVPSLRQTTGIWIVLSCSPTLARNVTRLCCVAARSPASPAFHSMRTVCSLGSSSFPRISTTKPGALDSQIRESGFPSLLRQ